MDSSDHVDAAYCISKSRLTPAQITEIRRELRMTPVLHAQYSNPFTKKNSHFNIYMEDANYMHVPRQWGQKNFGPAKYARPRGRASCPNMAFSGRMRDGQVDAVNACIEAFNTTGGGILVLPCGYGKTVVSLRVVAALKKRTLIVVNTASLMQQWVSRINEFLCTKDASGSGAVSVGTVQGSVVNLHSQDGKPHDVVVCMLQTLCQPEKFTVDTFRDFGLAVFDEVHHICAKSFSRALFATGTTYMLGLSATPNRKGMCATAAHVRAA